MSDSLQKTFNIDKLTGKITTKIDKALDYETTKEISIQIQATDTLVIEEFPEDKLHTVFTQAIIQVKDINDVAPKITVQNEFKAIEENQKDGTSIVNEKTLVKITAEDVDTEADLIFSIDWDATYATKQGVVVEKKWYENCLEIQTLPQKVDGLRSVFATLTIKQINENDESGKPITIDYEKYEYLYLTVVVTDTKTAPGYINNDTVKLTIPIADLNDNPPEFVQSTITSEKSVTETSGSQYMVIGSIIATDIDGPDYNKVKYLLKPLDEYSKDKIQINEKGQLYIEKDTVIDADTHKLKEYKYNVTACDGPKPDSCDNNEKNSLGTSAEISIEIIDINDKSPELKKPLKTIEVYENETKKALQDVIAEDNDVSSPNNLIAYFIDVDKWDPNNRNKPAFFDIGPVSNTVVLDCPDEKQCLDRDVAGGDKVTINIQLRDLNGTQNNYNTNKKPVKFELIIKDVNDNAPELQDANFEPRDENYGDGNKPIGQVKATDIDEIDTNNSKIAYHINKVYRTTDEDTEIVQEDIFDIDIDTGTIISKKQLRGYYGDISIEIIANDYGVPQMTGKPKNYTFKVEKYNFLEPSFIFPTDQPIVLQTIQSNLKNLIKVDGNPLEKIKATDNQGEKYEIKYTIIKQKDSEENEVKLFDISQKGNIASLIMTKERDPNEKIFLYYVTFECHHDGIGDSKTKNSTTIDTLIKFVDEGAEPYFEVNFENTTMKEESVIEEHPIPQATDPKEQPVIYYYLQEGDQTIFKVDKESGTLGLYKKLDRETVDFYSILILTSSSPDKPNYIKNNQSTLRIDITVEDINDNPPQFYPETFVYGLADTDAVDRTIIQLNATDPDLVDQPDGVLQFSMVPDTIKADGNQALQNLLNSQSQLFTVSKKGEVRNGFKATTSMTGYLSFKVQVTDSRKYIIKSYNAVKLH